MLCALLSLSIGVSVSPTTNVQRTIERKTASNLATESWDTGDGPGKIGREEMMNADDAKSPAASAVIVTAVLVFVLLIAFVGVFVVWRKRRTANKVNKLRLRKRRDEDEKRIVEEERTEEDFTTKEPKAASVREEETESTQSTAETTAMSVVEQREAPIGRMDSETKLEEVNRVGTEREVRSERMGTVELIVSSAPSEKSTTDFVREQIPLPERTLPRIPVDNNSDTVSGCSKFSLSAVVSELQNSEETLWTDTASLDKAITHLFPKGTHPNNVMT